MKQSTSFKCILDTKSIRNLIKNIDNSIICLKELMKSMKKYKERSFDSTSQSVNQIEERDHLIREKLEEFESLIEQFEANRKNLLTNNQSFQKIKTNEKIFFDHPQLFFSKNKLKELKIYNLIYIGFFENDFFPYFEKVFVISRKNKPQNAYAMKVTPRGQRSFQELEVGKIADKCPFLLETKAAFASELYLFYIMDFLNGGSLAFHLEKMIKFTEDQVIFYSAQIVCGLLYLHDRGFIYNNLLLENVHLDSNGNSKICDFKACINYQEDLKKISHSGGTVNDIFANSGFKREEYTPPEIFINFGRIEQSEDFWSLGIAIYKMLTGNFPFLNRESITNDEIPNLNQLKISEEAKVFIRSLLNKNQFERLGSRKNPNQVKDASFFNGIIWEKLENCEIDPPFKPFVESAFDISNFNMTYPKEIFDDVDNNGLILSYEEIITYYISTNFDTINQFTVDYIVLEEFLGNGGFGTVHLAKLPDGDELYALKAVKKKLDRERDKEGKIIEKTIDIISLRKEHAKNLISEKEIGILARQSRFLVKLIAAFQSTKYVFFFMEYLNGGSLSWHYEQVKIFPEEFCRFYSAQVICGILFLHSNDIIHRDLKLDNILLDSKGNAKICDFGLSCKLLPNEKLKIACGGPQYIAPEMFYGVYDHSVDYWTLGIGVFCLLAGEFPFNEDENGVNLTLTKSILSDCAPKINEIRRRKFPDMEEISENAWDFVNKLLNKVPEERLGSRNNPENIKEHNFFSKINWVQLENGDSEPPIKLFLNSIRTTEKPIPELIGANEPNVAARNRNFYFWKQFKKFGFKSEKFLKKY